MDSLNCLELAATHGSFTAAARRAHLSLAAFSDRIRRLEEHLGTPAIRAQQEGARLTPFGQRLLGQARRCLLEARCCDAMALAEARQGEHVMTVGAALYPGVWRIAPVLQTIGERHPHVRVHLRLAPGESLLESLLRGDVDLIVASHTSLKVYAVSHHAVRMAELWDEPYVLVGSADLLAARSFRCAADAERHALLDAGPELDTFRRYLEVLPPSPPWRFAVAHYLSVFDAMHALALRGLGVAVLPAAKVSADIAAGRLQRVLPHVQAPRRADLWPLAALACTRGSDRVGGASPRCHVTSSYRGGALVCSGRLKSGDRRQVFFALSRPELLLMSAFSGETVLLSVVPMRLGNFVDVKKGLRCEAICVYHATAVLKHILVVGADKGESLRLPRTRTVVHPEGGRVYADTHRLVDCVEDGLPCFRLDDQGFARKVRDQISGKRIVVGVERSGLCRV